MTEGQILCACMEILVARHKGWGVELMNTRRLHGQCDYQRKMIRLSRHLTKLPDAEAMDTILHEISHIETPYAGHGSTWQQAAMEIGARPERLARVSMPRTWIPYCPDCGKEYRGYFRRIDLNHRYCKQCGRTNLKWKLNPDAV